MQFNLAVYMNANNENSRIKHCPYPKYFKVRKFSETKIRVSANARMFGTAKYDIW